LHHSISIIALLYPASVWDISFSNWDINRCLRDVFDSYTSAERGKRSLLIYYHSVLRPPDSYIVHTELDLYHGCNRYKHIDLFYVNKVH